MHNLSSEHKHFKTPTGWLVAGVSLLLIGAGNLTYSFEGKSFSLGDLPALARFIIAMLGITLITIGAVTVSQRWTEHKKAVWAVLGVFWLTTIGAVGYDFFKPSPFVYPYADVTYYKESDKLNITLNRQALHGYGSKYYICAVVPLEGSRMAYDYKRVVFSEIIETPKSKLGQVSLQIDCNKKPISMLPLGSKLKVYLIGSDQPFQIREGSTAVADIDEGAKAIKRNFIVSIALREASIANMNTLLAEFTPEAKIDLFNKLLANLPPEAKHDLLNKLVTTPTTAKNP